MSREILQPGRTLGSYPEREFVPPNWFEATVDRLTGPIVRRTRARQLGAQKFLQQVHAAAAGLEKLDTVELRDRTVTLRHALLRDGLVDELCARAFAIVREVSGRTLGMRHFDSQIIGGWTMLQGMTAEMATGEGKTLTATLPVCTAAMAGIPVHVITVNDYLAGRDCELMSPLYNVLGMSVGAITEDVEDLAARQAVYACDIAYCTNQAVAFDYLRDRITMGHRRGRLYRSIDGLSSGKGNQLLLRGLCFALVDEADSVLIDEARTPLKLSGAAVNQIDRRSLRQALKFADQLDEHGDGYLINDRRVVLNERGKAYLAELTEGLDRQWTSPRRRELTITQALSARHLFLKDQEYIVRDGEIQIIDQNTGRVMPDRSWEMGLHQMIEAKEGLEITDPSESLARITYQRFFRRYLRVGAMTGTAQEVAGELWSVYRLPVVKIASNKPSQRRSFPTRIHRTAEGKWQNVVTQAKVMQANGRAVLIGTRSVETSEQLSERLTLAGIEHEVLNARQDRREADIVAQAGQPGRITVATNMAGRGTDIILDPLVTQGGGLHVIATERNEARRIDRQLFGRCARQGDPGSVEAILSWEDEIMDSCALRPIFEIARKLDYQTHVGQWIGLALARAAQREVERRHARTRRNLLIQDQRLEDVFAISGMME